MVKLSEKKLARLKVDQHLANLDEDSDHRLGDLIAQYGEDALLRVEREYEYYGEMYVHITVKIKRDENDAEYNGRITRLTRALEHEDARKKKQRKDKEAKDLADYQRLKKKFEQN